MKILLFMFEGSISNNKENNKECPLSPWDAPGKKYFFEFLGLIWKFCYLSLKVLSLIIKKVEILPPPLAFPFLQATRAIFQNSFMHY